MPDYDIFIKELIDETIRPDGELHALARKCYEVGYDHGKQSVPKGLPGVTSAQVRGFLDGLERDVSLDTPEAACAITGWFNDPDRDAPVKATMHPDLEWLASLPPERFVVPKLSQHCSGTPYFFKQTRRCAHEGAAWVKTSTIGWGTRPELRPVYAWDLAEIEQARKDLAKTENDEAEERRERTVLAKIVEDLVGEQIPDYETWFGEHGSNRLVIHPPAPGHPATVHELYTMFRARLLDELRQAGVIGTEGDDHV